MIPVGLATGLLALAAALSSAAVGVGPTVGRVIAQAYAGAAEGAPATTRVNFVTIPARQLWGGNYIAAGRAESVVVIGGATTVPTNATTVQLLVTAKGLKAGTLNLYPDGNLAEAAAAVHWEGGASVTRTVAANVGLNNKVAFADDSAAAATVTVKVTGYSTQVTAAGINGSGGTVGQVLTNTGTGSAWQVPALQRPASYMRRNASYVRLAAWGAEGVTLISIHLPPGLYEVRGVTNGYVHQTSTSTSGHHHCAVVTQKGAVIADGYTDVNTVTHNSSLFLQGQLRTSTGSDVYLHCTQMQGSSYAYNSSIIATEVGRVDPYDSVAEGAQASPAPRPQPNSPAPKQGR